MTNDARTNQQQAHHCGEPLPCPESLGSYAPPEAASYLTEASTVPPLPQPL